jgi:hypothetical protein
MFEQGAHNNDGKETPDHDTGRECGECQQQDVTSEKARTSVQTRSDRRDAVRRRNVISGSTGCSSGEVLEPLPPVGQPCEPTNGVGATTGESHTGADRFDGRP